MIEIKGRSDPSWIPKIRRVLKEECPDLILTHGFNSGFVAGIAVLGLKISIISSWHGNYFPSTLTQWLRKPFIDAMQKIVYRYMIKEIVTVSEFSRRELIRKGVDEKKIRIIHNGIPDVGSNLEHRELIRQNLGIPSGHFLIGAACRLSAEKGLDWFLKAVAIVARDRKDVRFVIWGDGPEKSSLISLTKKLGIFRDR